MTIVKCQKWSFLLLENSLRRKRTYPGYVRLGNSAQWVCSFVTQATWEGLEDILRRLQPADLYLDWRVQPV